MKSVIPILLASGCLAASAASASGLHELGDTALDTVTAGGVGAAVVAGALATGDYTTTRTSTGAIVIKNEGAADPLYSTSAAAGGTAVAVGSGGSSPSVSTGVVAASGAEGKQVMSWGWQWTMNGGPVQVSSAASYSVGTTAWEW